MQNYTHIAWRTAVGRSWLGTLALAVLLLSACRPVVPEEMAAGEINSDVPPASERSDTQEPSGGAISSIERALLEIEWSEPPPCENEDGVCARLLFRTGEELREITWSSAGIGRDTISLANVPEGRMSYSPDLTRLLVQAPLGHTGAGPLYLYNLETEELINLSERIGLPMQMSISALRPVGWRSENDGVLLVNEDDEIALLLNLAEESYEQLPLGLDALGTAPPRHFLMLPDGGGFTFIAPDPAAQSSTLYQYRFASQSIEPLLTVLMAEGQIGATALSPDGTRLAFVLQEGRRAEGRQQALHLLDITAREEAAGLAESELLLRGNFGPAPPTWSPTGELIALVQRNLSAPLRADPQAPPPAGDLWVVPLYAAEDGRGPRAEPLQLTFIEALAQTPTWSTDGAYLALATVDGQIGMVAIEQPGLMWWMDTEPIASRFVYITFIQ